MREPFEVFTEDGLRLRLNLNTSEVREGLRAEQERPEESPRHWGEGRTLACLSRGCNEIVPPKVARAFSSPAPKGSTERAEIRVREQERGLGQRQRWIREIALRELEPRLFDDRFEREIALRQPALQTSRAHVKTPRDR